MPEEGIQYEARDELLSYEEMEQLLQLLRRMGITKVRITGGEPFVRRNMMAFLQKVCQMGFDQVNITTNGTLTSNLVTQLKEIGISSVNLSIDSLDSERFFSITRRDVLPKVMETFHALMESGIPTKINAVVMDGQNIDDLIPMAELARQYPVDVRFIEEMPFNGAGSHYQVLTWNHQQIVEHLRTAFPLMERFPDPPHSTSMNYSIPGFKGKLGIIAAYSRTFCGSCNRIRVTPKGLLKTCLYDDGVFNVRDLIRAGASDEQIRDTFLEALGNRAKDGWEAEKNRNGGLPVTESMSTIGG